MIGEGVDGPLSIKVSVLESTALEEIMQDGFMKKVRREEVNGTP